MSKAIFFAFFVLSLIAGPISAAYGGPPPAPSASPSPSPSEPAPPEEKIDSDSPRASVSEFLNACNAGRYPRAAEFLELAPSDAPRAPLLARMLKAVLDRHLSIDLDAI